MPTNMAVTDAKTHAKVKTAKIIKANEREESRSTAAAAARGTPAELQAIKSIWPFLLHHRKSSEEKKAFPHESTKQRRDGTGQRTSQASIEKNWMGCLERESKELVFNRHGVGNTLWHWPLRNRLAVVACICRLHCPQMTLA